MVVYIFYSAWLGANPCGGGYWELIAGGDTTRNIKYISLYIPIFPIHSCMNRVFENIIRIKPIILLILQISECLLYMLESREGKPCLYEPVRPCKCLTAVTVLSHNLVIECYRYVVCRMYYVGEYLGSFKCQVSLNKG